MVILLYSNWLVNQFYTPNYYSMLVSLIFGPYISQLGRRQNYMVSARYLGTHPPHYFCYLYRLLLLDILSITSSNRLYNMSYMVIFSEIIYMMCFQYRPLEMSRSLDLGGLITAPFPPIRSVLFNPYCSDVRGP